MKKISFIAILVCLCLCSKAWPQSTSSRQYTNRDLTDNIMRLPTNSSILFDKNIYSLEGNHIPHTNYQVRDAKAVISLFTNSNLTIPYTDFFRVTIRFNIERKDLRGIPRRDTTELSIEYNPGAATQYRSKNTFTVDSAHYVTIKYESLSITDSLGQVRSNLPDSLFFLKETLLIDSYSFPTINEQLTMLPYQVATDSSYLKIRWQSLAWATQYDLEWTYVDDYNYPANTSIPITQIRYNFENNSTRVRITDTVYQIPLIFERGHLIFRVRGVANISNTNNDRLALGGWNLGSSTPYSPDLANHFYTIAQPLEQDKMYWQYIATYTEEGKRKDLLHFIDGSSRVRQSQTYLSSDNNLIVGESKYDFQGRPAIEILPTPFNDRTQPFDQNINGTNTYLSASPAMRFKPLFHVNTNNEPYSANDFDKDNSTGCGLNTTPLKNGAAQYYSPENANKTGHQAYVPDAEGYPFVQTQFTPDNTGRVSQKSNVGLPFKLGSGHEQKIFYTTPSQNELDRVFGNAIGFANHYQKEIIIDENGQSAVIYKTLQGKIVATALAGLPPEALSGIERPEPNTITVNLSAEINRREDNTWVAAQDLILTEISPISIDYQIIPEKIESYICSAQDSICYDCVYDLEVELKDNCGNTLWQRKEKIGSLNQLRTCQVQSFVFRKDTTLNAGNYVLTKRLSVNSATVEQYVQDFIKDTCLYPDVPLFNYALNPNACNPPCVKCQESGPIPTNYTDIDGRTVTIPTRFWAPSSSNCTPICPQDKPNPCTAGEIMIRADMSPNGQYGGYRDTLSQQSDSINASLYPLSIFNEFNQLELRGASWRKPVNSQGYQNADGSDARIEVVDGKPAYLEGTLNIENGKEYVKPQDLRYLADFLKYWQSSWAIALMPYHPEYGYLVWCWNQETSYDYDDLLMGTTNYSTANANQLTTFNDNQRNILENDPFFSQGQHPELKPLMIDSLNNFLKGAEEGQVLTIEQISFYNIHCAAKVENRATSDRGYQDIPFSEIRDCATSSVLFSSSDTTVLNKEWETYRSLYYAMRHKVITNAREAWIAENNGRYFTNKCIGNDDLECRSSIFKSKQRIFPDFKDAQKLRTIEGQTLENYTDFENYINNRQLACGICPLGNTVMNFLNTIAYEKALTKRIDFNDNNLPPLILPHQIRLAFEDKNATNYTWQTVLSDNLRLTIDISSAQGLQCRLLFEKDADTNPRSTFFNWSEIRYFSCLKSKSEGIYEITAFSEKGERMPLLLELGIDITCGQSTFKNICVKTELAKDLPIFINYLFESQNLSRNGGFTIYRKGAPIPAYFPESIIKLYRGNNTTWRWERSQNSFLNSYSFTGYISIAGPLSVDDFCDFTLRILTPGYTFEQVEKVIAIEPAATTTFCNTDSLVLRVLLQNKGEAFVSVKTGCAGISFNLFEGVTYSSNTDFCCMPIFPKAPIDTSCLNLAKDFELTFQNRWREERRNYLEDSIRQVYIEKCMRGAERFNVTYNTNIYHYTLFYYDEAGNLIKTVPPAGVAVLSNDFVQRVQNARLTGLGRITPGHSLITTYKYNSLNAVIEKNTPDGGLTLYTFDELGRIILSQDAVQRSEETASYLLYDNLGRIEEAGKIRIPSVSNPWVSKTRYLDFLSAVENQKTTKSEIYQTFYDEPAQDSTYGSIAGFWGHINPNLRNRIAAVYYFEQYSATNLNSTFYDAATHYVYDVLGNIKRQTQAFDIRHRYTPRLSVLGNYKTIEYKYDDLSGKVTQQIYQWKQPDQFIHWFDYDSDNRLTTVKTSTNYYEDEATIDIDATFKYYKHGPLARLVLGKEQVQGVDYAYTLQGWLKGVNSGTLSPLRDIGKDGLVAGSIIPKDVFGFTLGYHNADYKSIQSFTADNNFLSAIAGTPLQDNGLYNGNIRHISTALAAFKDNPVQTAVYNYDQLHRLRGMQAFHAPTIQTSNSWVGSIATNAYQTSLTYDANGNILTHNRLDQNGAPMDDLTYNYTRGTNRLRNIRDAVATTAYGLDLENQTNPDNYQYDAKGRLIADAAENNSRMAWTNTDKLNSITQDGQTTTFKYDAFGRRVLKTTATEATYYVRDQRGNILSTYNIKNDSMRWVEAPIYGSSRLGIYQPEVLIAQPSTNQPYQIPRHFAQYRGAKQYELVNQTGDVLTTISDRKVPTTTGYTADILAANDYYPFGMLMPERNHREGGKYNYGFQGMEQDNDVKGEGNAYTTEFRQYDVRVGRWLSVDEKANELPSLSTFNFSYNNPINFIDFDGRQATGPNDPTPANTQIFFDPRTSEIATRISDKIREVNPAAANSVRFDPQDTRLLAAVNEVSSRAVGERVAIRITESGGFGDDMLRYEVYVTRVSYVLPETYLGRTQITASASTPSTPTLEINSPHATVVGIPLPHSSNSPTVPATGAFSGHEYTGTAQLSIRVVTTRLSFVFDFPYNETVSRQDIYVPIPVQLTTTESPDRAIPTQSTPAPVSNAVRQQHVNTMDAGVAEQRSSPATPRESTRVPTDASVPAGVSRRQ